MRRKASPKLVSTILAFCAVLVLVTSASAGRAWCRADPVLIIDGQVVDIQVASSPAMYSLANGPIEMVVKVREGTRANVILEDFGFGYGYDIEIEKVPSLGPDVLAEVSILAPASRDTLPVTVHGTRVSTKVFGILGGRLDLLWIDDASGHANERITLQVK